MKKANIVSASVGVLVQLTFTLSDLKGPRAMEMMKYPTLDTGNNIAPNLKEPHPEREVLTRAPSVNLAFEPSSKKRKKSLPVLGISDRTCGPDELSERRPSPWAFRFALNPGKREDQEPFELRTVPKAKTLDADPFTGTFVERNAQFNIILKKHYEALWIQKRESVISEKSPAASYFAIVFSKQLTLKMKRETHYMRRTFGQCIRNPQSIDGWDNSLGLSHEFLTPFVYQLLLRKPCFDQWNAILSHFAKFIIQWKFLILLEPSLQVKLASPFDELIKEKTCKMLMWISEVLLNLYVQDFVEKVKDEENRKYGIQTIGVPEIKKVKSHGIRIAPIGHFYKLLVASPAWSYKMDPWKGQIVMKAFMDRWQVDCHDGYPVRNTFPMGEGEVKKSSRKPPPESKLVTWHTWCDSIIMIQKSAKEFAREIGHELSWQSVEPKVAYKIWLDWTTSPIFTDILIPKIRILDTSTRDLNIKSTSKMQQLLQEVPKIIWKPMGSSNSLVKLSYFLNLQDESFCFQFLPDKIEAFFNLDVYLGHEGMLSFERSFGDYSFKRVTVSKAVSASQKRKLKISND